MISGHHKFHQNRQNVGKTTEHRLHNKNNKIYPKKLPENIKLSFPEWGRFENLVKFFLICLKYQLLLDF